MRIFLDVGARKGESSAAVTDLFEQVVCFEPVQEHLRDLYARREAHWLIQPFALWNKAGVFPLHNPGGYGASLYADKEMQPGDGRGGVEEIAVESASHWFVVNIPQGADVFLKLNCEGAECDILEDLIENWPEPLAGIAVDFDVEKIPSQKHRREEILGLIPYSWGLHELPPGGPERVRAWVNSVLGGAL